MCSDWIVIQRFTHSQTLRLHYNKQCFINKQSMGQQQQRQIAISPRSRQRSFYLILDFIRVSLTPSNVPTNFCWNNQNKFGEKCKKVISDPKTGCHFPGSRSFEVKFRDKVPLTPNKVPTKFR